MIELFVTVEENTAVDKQHIGSFEFPLEAKNAIDEVAKGLFQEYKNAETLTFMITGYGEHEYYTKTRPETGAFANIPVPKEIHLRSELTNLNLKLVDNSKASEAVEEIEAKNISIKQWAKENQTKIQPF